MRRVVQLAVVFVLGIVSRAWPDSGVETLISFEAMTVTNRALVRAVMDHCTLRRQYEPRQFAARQAVFEYLLDHMELTSALAQSLGMIRYRAWRDELGRLHADDREGAAGFLLTVHAGEGKRVFYIDGAQRGLFTVRGRGVAVLEYKQVDAETMEYTGAVFVRVDNAVLAALARVFAIFLQGTVDRHFRHVVRHPVRIAERAAREPERLLAHVAALPEADRALAAGFAELVRSNAVVGIAFDSEATDG
jgi:hypothetical protein